MLQLGNIILSEDCLTEPFYCNYTLCKGKCCIEGDAGAPVTMDEVAEIENVLPEIEDMLSDDARRIIKEQGVAYIDEQGELVTSIVGGKDCVFACYDKRGCCLCAIEKAQREGRIKTSKPISCSLYPLRTKVFSNGTIGLNYHRWSICKEAVEKGCRLSMPVYKFLKEPLIRAFGKEWYDELEKVAKELKS